MSQENVETVRRGYEAFNRGDREGWLAFIHADAELVLPFYQALEGSGPAYGRAGAEQLWDSWHRAFPDASFEVDAIRDLGDTMWVAVRVRGRGARSDVPIDQPSWHVVEWRDDKIIRLQAFLREADALEAAGLSE
jgi:ketosteroid isomerase-like protein